MGTLARSSLTCSLAEDTHADKGYEPSDPARTGMG